MRKHAVNAIRLVGLRQAIFYISFHMWHRLFR